MRVDEKDLSNVADTGGRAATRPRRGPVSADTDRAETYLRLLAEAELRRPSPPFGPDSRAERVWLAATTLTAVDALDVAAARRAVGDFEAAAELRSGGPPLANRISDRPLWTPAPPATGGTRDHLRAVAAVSSLPLPDADGWFGQLHVLGAVVSGHEVIVAVAARWAGRSGSRTSPRPEHAPGRQIDAVDQDGRVYQCERPAWWDRGGGREWWDGQLRLRPAPTAGTRWLDIGAGQARVRVDLDATARPTGASVEPAPSPGAASRLLDRASEALLLASGSGDLPGVGVRVAELIATVTGSGAVSVADPAVPRLAALCRRLGLDVGIGAQSGGAAAGDALPEEWGSVLAALRERDGPVAAAPFACTLPRLGDAEFALAGLRSWESGATLQIVARGWMPRGTGWLSAATPSDPPPDPAYAWQARDSTGRWHLVEPTSWWYGSGTTHIEARLVPPVPRAATSLDVTLTGTGARARVSVPLEWRTVR